MPKMVTLSDRICAHSGNAAHATEVSAHARLLFCNGQVGARHDGSVPDDNIAQLEVIFERIGMILTASKMAFDDIVKLNVYVTEKSVLDAYFSVRDRVLGDHNPPATLMLVSSFPRDGVRAEIEAVAARSD